MGRGGVSWVNGTNQIGLAEEEAALQGGWRLITEVREVGAASGKRWQPQARTGVLLPRQA